VKELVRIRDLYMKKADKLRRYPEALEYYSRAANAVVALLIQRDRATMIGSLPEGEC